MKQAHAHNLPFAPESVGSHWSRRVQVDVVAVNHQSREILLGECKWGEEPVSRQIVRELIEQKGPKLAKICLMVRHGRSIMPFLPGLALRKRRRLNWGRVKDC